MRLKSRTIAYLGVMEALVFVTLALETFVFTAFLNPSPAFLTIPLAISLCLAGKKSDMFVGGTLLGVSSFILSFIIGLPPFMNPLISILPRIFIGVVAYYVYKLFAFLFKNSKTEFLREILPLSVSGLFGVLTNTVLTVCMLAVFDFDSIATVFTVILSINFLFEMISAVILVPTVATVIKKKIKR